MSEKKNKPKKELIRTALVRLTGDDGTFNDINTDILARGGIVSLAFQVDNDYVLCCEVRLSTAEDFYESGTLGDEE